jgi:hypothetical protein
VPHEHLDRVRAGLGIELQHEHGLAIVEPVDGRGRLEDGMVDGRDRVGCDPTPDDLVTRDEADGERLGIEMAGRYGRGLDRPWLGRHPAQPPGDRIGVVLDEGRRGGHHQRLVRRGGPLAAGHAQRGREHHDRRDERSHAVGTRRGHGSIPPRASRLRLGVPVLIPT